MCLCLRTAAGRPGDAVGVCARELGDPGLAALLARLLDGCDGGPLLRHLLQADLLPGARRATRCTCAALVTRGLEIRAGGPLLRQPVPGRSAAWASHKQHWAALRDGRAPAAVASGCCTTPHSLTSSMHLPTGPARRLPVASFAQAGACWQVARPRLHEQSRDLRVCTAATWLLELHPRDLICALCDTTLGMACCTVPAPACGQAGIG